MGKVPALDRRRCHARRGRRDLRLRRRALSRSEAGARRWAIRVVREISAMAVLRAGLHRACHRSRSSPRSRSRPRPRPGASAHAGVRRAGSCARQRARGSSARNFLGRRHRDRLRAEFRGAAVQDGAVAPVVRCAISTRCMARPAFQRASRSRRDDQLSQVGKADVPTTLLRREGARLCAFAHPTISDASDRPAAASEMML